MNGKAWMLMAVLLLWAPLQSHAQGFAGMAANAEGFSLPERGHVFEFPRDHGPHPQFRIEWWYLTATLTGDDGEDYGAQWTLFRSALTPASQTGWNDPQVWFAHAAATSASNHFHAERFARGGVGQVGVTAEPFEAWLDDWAMTGQAGRGLDELRLTARGDKFAYELSLSADTPLVFHGDNGFSQKSPDGQASHYYSQPAYDVTGTLSLPQGDVVVTGTGWLDREWSSQPLRKDQEGWDWFSLSFDDGAKLMAYRLRGPASNYTPGTWIAPDGQASPIAPGDIELKPLRWAKVAGRQVPVQWRLEFPDRNVAIDVNALNDQAWNETNVAYWEGPVRISGSHSGRGYLEMTGYEP